MEADRTRMLVGVIVQVFLLIGISAQMGPTAVGSNDIHCTPSRTGYPQQDGGNDSRLLQYRSMWLEGYQIINHSEVQKVVDTARRSNINCLSPLINGNYLGNFYNSSYHPRYKELTWDFDPLMDLIRESHKYGIHVMPWFHTMIDYFALKTHPEWGCVTNTGYRSTSWLNPTLPSVQSYIRNVTYQLMRDYPLDGIKLDTIRYPGSNYGYDSYSIQMYNEEGWTDFNAFRRQQVTESITAISDAINEVRPYVWIGADIFTDRNSRQNYIFQDSELWSEMGIVDLVTPMIYTTSISSYRTYVDLNIGYHSCPVVAGTYVYTPGNTAHGSVPDNDTGIALMLAQTEYALGNGALGVCLFAYKFLFDFPTYQNALRSGSFSANALCPLKEQSVPVRDSRWEFERDHDREGFRVVDMGHHYPIDGFWSISSVTEPSLMTPLLNITAEGTNVIEVSMISESKGGSLRVYWSCNGTVFTDRDMVEVPLASDGEWHLYSVHLDRSISWKGRIAYLRVVPTFRERTNITLDLIRLYWMPDCIKEWAYLGPFLSGGTDGLVERDFLGGEAEVAPRLGDVISGRTWMPFGMERDLIDLRFELGGLSYSVAYSHIYVISGEAGDYELRIGSSDGAKVYLNGETVIESSVPRRVSPDQNVSIVRLERGMNRVLFKQAVYENELSFFARFTRPGNWTETGLTYLLELPVPPPPHPRTDFEDWTNGSPITFFWDEPVHDVGISHYEWSLDSGPLENTSKNSLTLMDIMPGRHIFEVRSVDLYGTRGEFSLLDFGLDPEAPVISPPISRSTVVIEPSITWEWNVEHTPQSGIKGFFINVIYIAPNGDRGEIFPDEIYTEETCFTLDDRIIDTFSYRLKVRAESWNGLSHTVQSRETVLVDLLPPVPPQGLALELLDGTRRVYRLTWYPSVDNVWEGIDRYEVVQRGTDGTRFLGTTRYTVFNVTRELGNDDPIQVRSFDRSGYASKLSDPVRFENVRPHPSVEVSRNNNEGSPLHFSASRSWDEDGAIVSFAWYLRGELKKDMPDLFLTLDSGAYEICLEVEDDLGAKSSLDLMVVLTRSPDPLLNMTLKEFIDASSSIVIELPAMNRTIRNNITILEPPILESPVIGTVSIYQVFMVVLLLLAPIFTLASIVLFFLNRKPPTEGPSYKERFIQRAPAHPDMFRHALNIGPNIRQSPVPFFSRREMGAPAWKANPPLSARPFDMRAPPRKRPQAFDEPEIEWETQEGMDEFEGLDEFEVVKEGD